MSGEIKNSVTGYRQATGLSERGTSMPHVCCKCVEGKVCVLGCKDVFESEWQQRATTVAQHL